MAADDDDDAATTCCESCAPCCTALEAESSSWERVLRCTPPVTEETRFFIGLFFVMVNAIIIIIVDGDAEIEIDADEWYLDS